MLPALPDWSWLFCRVPAMDGWEPDPRHIISGAGATLPPRLHPENQLPLSPAPVEPGDAGTGAPTARQKQPAPTCLFPTWCWGGPYLAASSRCEAPGPGSTELPCAACAAGSAALPALT